MGQVLLKTENLVKQFEGLVAVNQVTFDIQEGEILTIIGPNGAGKSCLFGLISGLLPAPLRDASLFKEMKFPG